LFCNRYEEERKSDVIKVDMPEPAKKSDAPKKRAAKSGAAKIEALKQKYRLDDEVNLSVRGKDGLPLGKGPLLDPQVIEKFSELDTTKDKRYLDWMLFQAGGGAEAFRRSLSAWGEGTPETSPDEIISRYNSERTDQSVHFDELRLLVKRLQDKGYDITPLLDHVSEVEAITRDRDPVIRFKKLTELIKSLDLVPGKEPSIALEIVTNKFKAWMKNQLQVKVRDRVHVTHVYRYMVRGGSREEAEEAWNKSEPRRRREYVFGDQDSLKWDNFGYNRHWPGRDGIYEHIYNATRQFILNINKLERRQQMVDAQIEARNKTLPPDQQIPPKKVTSIPLDIGKVLVDSKGNLTYKGHYPTVSSVIAANEEIAELPLRSKIETDVRYAGPKGVRSRDAKVYSDENLDVFAPLTVAAAIKAGDPRWEVTDPNQLSVIKPNTRRDYASGWKNYTSGIGHGHFEWEGIPAIPLIFHIKNPSIALPDKLRKLLMTVFVSDLVDLQAPYSGTVWRVAGDRAQTTFTGVMRQLKLSANKQPEENENSAEAKSAYLSLVRSFTKAMNTLKEWGKEFDPQDMVSDYVKHHRERMQGKRTLGEDVRFRAAQVVEALLE
jgi:hypothetical protein